MAASEEGHLEVVERLLKGGADVNTVAERDGMGRTALGFAVSKVHSEVVEALKRAGAIEKRLPDAKPEDEETLCSTEYVQFNRKE